MAWWENGVGSYKAKGTVTTPGAQYSYNMNNLVGGEMCGSISMDPNKPIGETYSILLNTFALGTQLYLECTPQKLHGTARAGLLRVDPLGFDFINTQFRAYLKKGDTKVYISPVFSGSPFNFITSFDYGAHPEYAFSCYKFNYIQSYNTGNVPPDKLPGYAFPKGGASAVLTNQIACVSIAGGLSFLVCGFPSMAGPYAPDDTYINFDCPAYGLFTLADTYLNDPFWFDPVEDLPQPDSGDGDGEGGNVPKLPINGDYPKDDIDFPDLPTGANAFGFSRLTLYKPTDNQLADALDILYTDSTESTLETIIESCKKWWYKPEQYCISLMIMPVDVTAANSKAIKFGKYNSQVVAPYISNQWVITDCGSISVPLKYGTFYDFEPYAKVKIYLPFIGFRSLNANEVIGGTIAIKYYTDMLTGASVCHVKVTREGSSSAILYTFECNIAMQVPLTSNNYDAVVSNLLSAGVAGITMGISAAASGIAGSVVSGASNMGSPELTQSGNLSANTGMLSHKKPYICVQMPVPTTPSNYNNLKGRPSNIFANIGSCRGLTIVKNLHVDIPGATDEEKNLIKAVFERGVII